MPLLFVALALCCLGARLGWEVIDPLQFWESKAWIYVRDAITLGPAVGFALLGVARRPPPLSPRSIPTPALVASAAVFATVAAFVIAHFVLLGVPAVADEAAYLWQGALFNTGHLTAASDPVSEASIISYVYDLDGRRISVFFPGSALALALGHRIGMVELMNPLLVGALTVVTYWAAKRLFDERVARIATVLFAISPFTLFQGASFFGHVWTGLLIIPAVTFALTPKKRWEPFAVGFLLAAALFSRPVSAAVAGLAVVLWILPSRRAAVLPLIKAVAGGLIPLALFAWYNHELTGSVLTTAHRLFLPDESLQLNAVGVKNAAINLAGLAVDLNGLIGVSLVLVAVAAKRGGTKARFLAVYGLVHLCCYALYYNNGVSYGPRYLFEISPFFTMLVVVGALRYWSTKDRIGALVAIAACVTLVIFATRAPLFHERAEYLDLQPTIEAVDGSQSVVLISRGPFPFPDPMYPAFARSVDPDIGPVFLRDSLPLRCVIEQQFPGRDVYELNMVDKFDGRSSLQPVTKPEGCLAGD